MLSKLQSNTVIAATVTIFGALTPITPALAADLGGARLEAPYEAYDTYSAPQRQFYVRGDVGVGNFSFGNFTQAEVIGNGGSFIQKSISDSTSIGAGFGWQISNRFRLDFTGEYRSSARFKALDNVTAEFTDGSKLQANTLYDGNLASYVGLMNGYVDLFRWRGFTPYVGAGIGFAHHQMTGFTSTTSAMLIDGTTGAETVQLSNGVAGEHSQTNLAWALMAGTSYDISPNGKLDIGYRYTNLGSADLATGLIDCVCGTIGQPLKVSDLENHEFRIGVRWLLGNERKYAEHAPLK